MKRLQLAALGALSIISVAALAAPTTVCVQFKNNAQYIPDFTVQGVKPGSKVTTVLKGQTTSFLPFQANGTNPAINLVSGEYTSKFDITQSGVGFYNGVLFPQTVTPEGKKECGGAMNVAYKVEVIREY